MALNRETSHVTVCKSRDDIRLSPRGGAAVRVGEFLRRELRLTDSNENKRANNREFHPV